jgi:adenylylsulfate kinase
MSDQHTPISLNDEKIEHREHLRRHRGAIVWLTGLSGSGKSTVANKLNRVLAAQNFHTYVIDGDKLRQGLNSDLGFSNADRNENIRRIGEVAKLFMDAGTITIVAAISPFAHDRDRVRQGSPKGRFFEIWCASPLEVCEFRDVKGLYRKARAGQLLEFTGISSPYENPTRPELTLDTHTLTIEECVAQVIDTLCRAHILPSDVRTS